MEKEEIEKQSVDENSSSLEQSSETSSSEDDGEITNKEQTTSLEEENKKLEDKIIRLYAEMENQRRRYEKEKDEAFEYGGFSFAKEALSLLDNLERSKQYLQNDESFKNNDAVDKILDHLDIIYDDMISIFKKNNITLIKAIGKKLDPNLHQAMIEIEDDSKEVGTVIQEIQKGFLLKERLLRPSLVGVSKKSTKKEEKKEDNDQKGEKIE